MVRTTTGLNGRPAGREVGKPLHHLGALDLQVDNFARAHAHRVLLKHLLGDVETNDLLAVHDADDWSRVQFQYYDCWRILGGLVKTAVHHLLGTLMPYPSEDPPRAG